jgi:hypothetical protein
MELLRHAATLRGSSKEQHNDARTTGALTWSHPHLVASPNFGAARNAPGNATLVGVGQPMKPSWNEHQPAAGRQTTGSCRATRARARRVSEQRVCGGEGRPPPAAAGEFLVQHQADSAQGPERASARKPWWQRARHTTQRPGYSAGALGAEVPKRRLESRSAATIARVRLGYTG